MRIRNIVIGACLAFLLCGAESVLYNRTLGVAACHTYCSYTVPCVNGCSEDGPQNFAGKECCHMNQEQHPTCLPCYVRYYYWQNCKLSSSFCPEKWIYLGQHGSGAYTCCCCWNGTDWVCGHPCSGQCDSGTNVSTCP